MKSYR